MQPTLPLQPGHIYHLYNRGNNRDDIFFEARNYRYFLQLYARYILPVADTFAYCLLKNHFHLLVRVKTIETSRVSETREVSQAFSNLFNAYAKAINSAYGRTGSLFEERFRRLEVTDDDYLVQLILYIHYNPQKHGFVDDFCSWPWSSYSALRGRGFTHLMRAEVLSLFGDVAEFERAHTGQMNETPIRDFVGDD